MSSSLLSPRVAAPGHTNPALLIVTVTCAPFIEQVTMKRHSQVIHAVIGAVLSTAIFPDFIGDSALIPLYPNILTLCSEAQQHELCRDKRPGLTTG